MSVREKPCENEREASCDAYSPVRLFLVRFSSFFQINDVITDDDAEKVRSSEKFIALARSARKVVPIVFFIFGPIIFILSLLGIIYYCKAAPKGTS
jgi:hypothetical protein